MEKSKEAINYSPFLQKLRTACLSLFLVLQPIYDTNITDQHSTTLIPQQRSDLSHIIEDIKQQGLYKIIDIDNIIEPTISDSIQQDSISNFCDVAEFDHNPYTTITIDQTLHRHINSFYHTKSIKQQMVIDLINSELTKSLRNTKSLQDTDTVSTTQIAHIPEAELLKISWLIPRDTLYHSILPSPHTPIKPGINYPNYTSASYKGNDGYIKLHHGAALQNLHDANINVTSRWSQTYHNPELGDNSASDRTCLEGINQHTISGIIQLLNHINKKYHTTFQRRITGGTEQGHTSGVYDHEHGYKVDISGHGVAALALHHYLHTYTNDCTKRSYGWLISHDQYQYEVRFHDMGSSYHFDITVFHVNKKITH